MVTTAQGREIVNGAALAALAASGIGTFAMGLIVVLNEIGVIAAPAIYGPAGGVSGRTAMAVAVWLIGWAILQRRWKGRQVEPGAVVAVTIGLVALGVLGTFPPVWGLL